MNKRVVKKNKQNKTKEERKNKLKSSICMHTLRV